MPCIRRRILARANTGALARANARDDRCRSLRNPKARDFTPAPLLKPEWHDAPPHDQLGIRKRNFIVIARAEYEYDSCTKRSIHRGCLRCQLRSASTHRSQSEIFVRFQLGREEGAALDLNAQSLAYRSLLGLCSRSGSLPLPRFQVRFAHRFSPTIQAHMSAPQFDADYR